MEGVTMLLAVLLGGLLTGADHGPVAGTRFRRYSANGSTFYLSEGKDRLPLIVWVQGTGCGSHFTESGGRIFAGPHSLLEEAAAGRAVVMAVEKPGVRYLDDPANLRACRPEFYRDFALDRWAARIAAAIAEARKMRRFDPARTLIVGHSEGGIVAMKTANLAQSVTHAASLAGGGPSYLFHIAEYFRSRGMNPDDVYACWQRVRAAPDAIDRFCWDQTHRQWTSFMRTSLIGEALRSRAALLFAHGTADEQNSIHGFDVLRAELEAAGKAAVYLRMDGANHAFDAPGQQSPEGLVRMFQRAVAWFLGGGAR